MNASGPKFVHLNGRVVASTRARISAFDRGLWYGDGLFETLRAYQGRPFGLDEHLARLRRSASFLNIKLPSPPWRLHIAALLKRNRLLTRDAWVRITVTRGPAAPGLLPPPHSRPTVLIASGMIDPGISVTQQHGARVTLLPFARSGFLAEHKVLDYLPAVLGKIIAARHESVEGLFVDADGLVSEGTTSNVFVWRRRRLLTPPTAGVLPGLTRRLVLEAAIVDGWRVSERPLTTCDLLDADEVFITSSLAEVVPVIAIDRRRIGNGRPGPRTERMQHLYRQLVDDTLVRG